MKKVFAVLISVVLLLLLSVSCSSDGSVDEAFNCTITFNGNGATSGEMPVQIVGRGIGTRLNANTFEKTDYRFAGWNTEPDGSGTAYADGQNISITENTTLYAQWVLHNAYVTFNSTGGLGTMERQKIVVNTSAPLNPNSFTRIADEAFTGWNTKADGSGTAYTDGQEISIAENITLYAQWSAIPTENLTSGTTSWTDGTVYTLTDDVTIGSRITVNGNVNLLLPDGLILTASEGIFVGEGNSLTIWADGLGTGKLEATGSTWNAGIGSNRDSGSGTITINSGTVFATGGIHGAGIGSGVGSSGGTININGGIVEAVGGQNAAGIGAGYIPSENCIWTINISGGTVTATGGDYSAGIGTGYDDCNVDLNISGGTITANGGKFAAAIGGGYFCSGINVTITGGKILLANGGQSPYGDSVGIGRGLKGADDGTLTLGEGVALEVSSNGSDWSDYEEPTRQRYMRTK